MLGGHMSKKKNNIDVNIDTNPDDEAVSTSEAVVEAPAEGSDIYEVVGTDNLTIWLEENTPVSVGYLKRGDKATKLEDGEQKAKIYCLNRATNWHTEGWVYSEFLRQTN